MSTAVYCGISFSYVFSVQKFIWIYMGGDCEKGLSFFLFNIMCEREVMLSILHNVHYSTNCIPCKTVYALPLI